MKRKPFDKNLRIAQMKQANFNKSAEVGIITAQAINFAIMLDVYGWTAEDCKTHMGYIRQYRDSYAEGFESITKLVGDLKEEIGIDLMDPEQWGDK